MTLIRRATASVGCAPLPSQSLTFSSSSSISRGIGLRVVAADDLEELPVARRARVGRDDAVDRVLLGAHSREPELDCHRRQVTFDRDLPLALRSSSCAERRRRAAALRRPSPASRPCRRGPGSDGHLALPHLLHHLLHHLARLEQLVDLLHGRARAARDPLAAVAVDHVRDRALARRHREHDRLDALQPALVDVERRRAAGRCPGIIFSTPCSGPIRRSIRCACRKSSKVNWPLRIRASIVGLLVLGDRLLGALDQRQHVAHAEDPRRHAVGVEDLERVELLAGRGEHDRLAGDAT